MRFERREPVRLRRAGRSADRHRRQAGRHRRARRRLCAADRGGGRRRRSACSPRSSGCSAVHARIADRLARDGLPLLAQHVDPIDTGTLVDIFRDDPRAVLLGTDALARRGRRAGRFAAAGGDGAGALAAADGAPRGAAAARRTAAAPTTTAWCGPGWRRRSGG